jgi:hypothetical protein
MHYRGYQAAAATSAAATTAGHLSRRPGRGYAQRRSVVQVVTLLSHEVAFDERFVEWRNQPEEKGYDSVMEEQEQNDMQVERRGEPAFEELDRILITPAPVIAVINLDDDKKDNMMMMMMLMKNKPLMMSIGKFRSLSKRTANNLPVRRLLQRNDQSSKAAASDRDYSTER